MAHQLLNSQEAAIFVAIQEEGFSPHEFRLADAKLVHKSGAFLNFSSDARSRFVITFEPGAEHVRELRKFGSWPNVIGHVHEWLGYLRRELETPDFWAMLEADEVRQVSSAEQDNTVFTPEEVAQIERQLAALKEHVQTTYELNEAQSAVLTARLDELVELARSQRRWHWRAIFIGYLFEVFLPPEVVRELVLGGLRALAELFGGGMPELPGGGGGPPLAQ